MSDTTTVPTLTDLGWDETTAGAFDDAVTGSPLRGSSVAPPTRNVGPKDGAFDLVAGRVGRVDRGRVTVHTADGPTPALVRLPAGSELEDQPTTGDWVGLERRPDGDVVRVVLPRSSAIVRKAAGERSDAQVMAANLDHVLVAVPFETRVNLSTIERYLVVAWESGAQPLVVLTKCDLAYDPDATRAEVETAAPGVDVHVVSAETGEGVDVLAAVLSGGTTALVGQSGAGKSTLVNVLAGEEVQLVSGTRQDGKGRHTTTARELIALTGGGVLIDTPRPALDRVARRRRRRGADLPRRRGTHRVLPLRRLRPRDRARLRGAGRTGLRRARRASLAQLGQAPARGGVDRDAHRPRRPGRCPQAVGGDREVGQSAGSAQAGARPLRLMPWVDPRWSPARQ